MMRLNSLAFRLFVTAAGWTLLVLPITAIVLTSVYRSGVERGFDARLNLYLTTLVTQSLTDNVTQLRSPPNLGEPLFDLPLSGWYWQIKPLSVANGTKLHSESLIDAIFVLPSEQGLEVGQNQLRVGYVSGPENQQLRVVEREITLGDGQSAQKYSYAVAGDAFEIDDEISRFQWMLSIALTLLGLGLVLATFFQVKFGLRPLRAIEKGLTSIRSGDAENLTGEFPAEIEPLQNELNALIQSNRDVVERARTHVGNLAHALKTPLSVITNEASINDVSFSQKVLEQAVTMREQINHHLDRARMAARVGVVSSVTDVNPVLESLIHALERIYEEKGIDLQVKCPTDAKFQGEKHDLEEMLGNLLDNACKWANSRITLYVKQSPEPVGSAFENDRLTIYVDDDGPGLEKKEREEAIKRGLRLDESKPGTGLGLSIVAELAHLYKGSFKLDESPLGGLRAELILPAT